MKLDERLVLAGAEVEQIIAHAGGKPDGDKVSALMNVQVQGGGHV
ncbi:hypothetical protein [Acidisoma cellulosilyticum]|nr:hypothetical protein [Acidisoma cellulosilyticum]